MFDIASILGQVLGNNETLITNPMIYQGNKLNLHVLFNMSVEYRFDL